MRRSTKVAPLQIDDEDFVVASTIDRCPKTMMVRELVMNALEAAGTMPAGKGRIGIRVTKIDGVDKLALRNNGKGMSATELHAMCNLAASIGKAKGLDDNFGMGAKVACLPSNRHGVRYRSCKDRRVSQVILCERDGIYGRLKFALPDSDVPAEVMDVTDIAIEDGHSIDQDWTEVVLLGNRPDQNTNLDPYDGNPKVEPQWLASYLYHRFYRLPGDIEIVLGEGTHKLDGRRRFETITRRVANRAFQKAESVSFPSGVKIHYLYDPADLKSPTQNKSGVGGLQTDASTCAIVYKSEMYDVRKDRAWSIDAPIFGIPFGARHISIHFELPDRAGVRPDGYREYLRYIRGEQAKVMAGDFAVLIRESRPAWLVDLVKLLAPEGASANQDLREELQSLLDELRIKRNRRRIASVPSGGDAQKAANAAGIDLTAAPTGAHRATPFAGTERAPQIIELHSEAEIAEKQLTGRAARYYGDPGVLFVNMTYPSVTDMREQLEKEYADANDGELMRSMCLRLAERTLIQRVGRAVVYALVKQLNKEWDSTDVSAALAPESLSLAADDYREALQEPRRTLGARFRPKRERRELREAAS